MMNNNFYGMTPYGVATVNEVLANAPSDEVEETTNEEEDGFASYFPTIYNTIWGKDDEEKLIKAQARLEYFQQAIKVAPFLSPFLQTEINRLNAQIKSLKQKVVWAKVRRYGLGASALGVSWVLITWGIKNLRKPTYVMGGSNYERM